MARLRSKVMVDVNTSKRNENIPHPLLRGGGVAKQCLCEFGGLSKSAKEYSNQADAMDGDEECQPKKVGVELPSCCSPDSLHTKQFDAEVRKRSRALSPLK
jgi:hypothetical protein